jgi:hypothetical protein
MGVQVSARQLHLFKSRRQRGILAPAPNEYQLHCAVADTVKRWIMPGWIYTHIASGEKRDQVTAARLKRMGVTAGFPDLVCLSNWRPRPAIATCVDSGDVIEAWCGQSAPCGPLMGRARWVTARAHSAQAFLRS